MRERVPSGETVHGLQVLTSPEHWGNLGSLFSGTERNELSHLKPHPKRMGIMEGCEGTEEDRTCDVVI